VRSVTAICRGPDTKHQFDVNVLGGGTQAQKEVVLFDKSYLLKYR
jgi:hypothetical protein